MTTLVARGTVLDPRNVYFLARLSPRYPTLEVRVADTCLTARDAVVLAALVRALVSTLAEDVRLDRPSIVPLATPGSLRDQLVDAAHHGLTSTVARPRPEGTRTPVTPGLSRLIDAILPELEAAGDAELVRARLEELERIGTAAQRQRALWAAVATREAFVSALAEATSTCGSGVSRRGGSAPTTSAGMVSTAGAACVLRETHSGGQNTTYSEVLTLPPEVHDAAVG